MIHDMLLALYTVLSISNVCQVSAFILKYEGSELSELSVRQQWFAAIASSSPVDNDGTVINIDLTLKRDMSKDTSKAKLGREGFIELTLIANPELDAFPGRAAQYPRMLSFCCLNELHKGGRCDRLGTLLLPSNVVNPNRETIVFPADKSSLRFQKRIALTGPNSYMLLLSHCDIQNIGPVLLDGSVSIKSSNRHLPPHLWNLLSFYNIAVWFTLGMLVIFAAICARYRRNVYIVHVIVLGQLISMIIGFLSWMYYLSTYDETGYPGFSWFIADAVSLLTRSSIYGAMTLFLYGYGLTAPLSLSDISVRHRKQMGLLVSAYAGCHAIVSWNLQGDSFLQRYDISHFLPLILIDIVGFSLLSRPALKTMSFLRTGRPELVRFFQWTCKFLLALLTTMIGIAGISINLAENRASIKHTHVIFLFPEALVQMAQVLLMCLLLCVVTPRYTHDYTFLRQPSALEIGPLQ
uniref:Intimal thickness related receptor IRP domain-containing protein n=1 Tax=Spongospora subterranea TaxID=70186 RepID=A0A0H5QRM1_9EUKA|eukprot:CRZ04267.1 hypothetical protein [Spongospora subterranea]